MNLIDKIIRAEAQKMNFELPEDFDSFLSDTFEKLNHKGSPGKKTFLRNKIRTILIAAALVICLTASAFAVSDVRNWFVGYFASKAGEELTESQVVVLEQNTAELGSSATCNDITVTAESISGDNYIVYIKIKIESVPSISLKDKELAFIGGGIYLLDHSNKKINTSSSYQMLDDESSTDNCVYMLITMNCNSGPDSDPTLSDSSDKMLCFEGLSDGYNGDEISYIAKGPWKISLSYDAIMESVELITEPLQVYGDSLQDGNVSVKMTSFVLSSFGATCTYEIDDGFPAQAVAFDHVGVYMKDGTFIRLIPGRSSIGRSSFKFELPISLKEADYIQLDQNTRIYSESFITNSTLG